MPFASHLALSIGFFAGILPSVLLIFMTLKEYDEYYEDKQFFFLMVVGLFAGMMTALIYYWSIIYMGENLSFLVFFFVIVGFAIYEMLLFTIILSMKRFGGKFELTFYGVVLGGSVAGILGMFCIYVYLHTHELTTTAAISILLMVPTLPIMYLSLGAMVGFGLFKDKYFKYAGYMVILKTIFNFLFIFWFILFLTDPVDRGWHYMLFGFIFAIIMYNYAFRELLPSALPERLKKHMRRAKRKRKRK